MKLILRVLGDVGFNTNWKDLPNPFNSIPSKGDHLVFKGKSYIIMYLEYDYDGEGTIYLVCKEN